MSSTRNEHPPIPRAPTRPRGRPESTPARARSAASSGSGRPARTSPSSPTTGSTRCSTAARRPPASPSSDGGADRRLQGPRAWSPRSSTSRRCPSLRGHIAVGHCRYSTTGSTTWENAQPTFRTTAAGTGIALGHNGNLVNTAELRDEVAALRDGTGNGRDGVRQHRLRRGHPAARRDRRRHRRRGGRDAAAAPLRGAFCLVFCDEHTLYAARDPHGVRPLVLGRLERGWVVASETAALDIVGASFVREVEPGELLAIDADGMRSSPLRRARAQGLRLRVRLPRPPGHHDLRARGARRPASRSAAGWPQEAPVEADLVIPTPESGTPAAIGYAQASGIPYGQGLVKNAYVGPHVHPAVARPSASSASGSSSTRCATSSAASAWSWSTTRSCAATPSARWSACCARPARSRCTSGSPRRRCAGRASTASTSPPAPS